ncbi:glycosyltransferase [Streptomyces canus]|uniref:glycosyltransferase n=1 Tax=Streptomyces canus TaxID=58343 RepID=UPI002E28A999|nr:glycosyltransferase [Streptomyces canus]
MTTTGPRVLTGIDLPPGSPGGSVELLADLYGGDDPLIPADVFMLAPPGGPVDPHDDRHPGRAVTLDVPGKAVAGPDFWAYVDALAQALRHRFAPRDGVDVLHLQHLAFGATPALARAFPGPPRVALLHGTDLLYAADHPTQHTVLTETTATADAVVAPTVAMADRLCRTTRATPRRVVHIPWGVPDHLLSAPPARTPRPDGPLRVLYAGRLTPEKGGAELFTELGGLPGIEVSVAAPLDQYDDLAVRLGPARRRGPRPLGWLDRPALWKAFAEHDLLIMPSNRLEAFGLVAVEAQACGLPVLYRTVPGLAEVLGDSAAGYDPHAAVRALPALVAELRDDPAALEQLRAAGLRNARRFPLSATAQDLRRLSEEVRGGSRPSAVAVRPGRTGRSTVEPPGSAPQLLAMRGLYEGPSELTDPALYARIGPGAAATDRHGIRLEPATEAGGNTYFGRFPASYWQRWTRVREVTVRLTAGGSGRIRLRASDSRGDARTVAAHTLCATSATEIVLVARLDRFLDGGALWLDLGTGPEERLSVRDVRWTVPTSGGLRRTAAAICTMDRPAACLGNLEALARDETALAVLDRVYVVDQGGDRVRDQDGFDVVQHALGGRLRYLTQPNIGGAGGFSRGLHETVEAARTADGTGPDGPVPPDVLFMDDDVLLDPDLLVRMTAFAASTAEPLVLGGQMLNLLHPTRLHAGAEYTDLDRAAPGMHMPHSLQDAELVGPDPRTGRPERQELRLDAGYNGWWACLIPAEVTATIGYPLPLFFQGDDAEYSYRARAHGIPTLTLPGAGLWHTDFGWKDRDEINRYFIVRNYMIISALHGRFSLPTLCSALAGELASCLMGMEYGAAATVIAAVEDFLKGPRILQDGGQEALARLRRLRAGYPETRTHPVTDVPGVRSNAIVITDPPKGAGPRLRDLALLRALLVPLLRAAVGAPDARTGGPARGRRGGRGVTGLPSDGGAGPDGRVLAAVRHGDARWWHLATLDAAVVTDASQQGVRLRRYDAGHQARLTRAAARALWRLLREGPDVRGPYRAALPGLSSRENWVRLFGASAGPGEGGR